MCVYCSQNFAVCQSPFITQLAQTTKQSKHLIKFLVIRVKANIILTMLFNFVLHLFVAVKVKPISDNTLEDYSFNR